MELPVDMNSRHHRSSSGFSLVEVAIVLMILGIVLGGLLGAIGQNTENARRIEAKNELREIEEALYAFAQVQGRLPCPASNTSVGFEVPVGGGDCTVTGGHGFLPSGTLNLTGSVNTDGLLLDPWGNPWRYSVATRDASNSERAFTHVTGLSTFFNNSELSATNMLRICAADDCSVVLANMVPAVVLTMGSNWSSFTSANEIENGSGGTLGTYSVTNTTDFVYTGYSELNFDDQLVWLSPHVLFGKMIAAGRLP